MSPSSRSEDTLHNDVAHAHHLIRAPSWDIGLFHPIRVVLFICNLVYAVVQQAIIVIFKPIPPTSSKQPSKNPFGRIAIVGAGLTGVSSAAHCIAHNFDVVIYDQNTRVGGIWANVNTTSGLQINSLLYRFHPAVFWSRAFPKRDEILKEIHRIWEEYQLETRTRFNTSVTKIRRAPLSKDEIKDADPSNLGHARWVINDGADGVFDAVIVAVGTCGEPQRMQFEGIEAFEREGGRVVHSSELDKLGSAGDGKKAKGSKESRREIGEDEGDASSTNAGENTQKEVLDVQGKDVVVIGSGASGVEAAEWAVERGAKCATILARDDKWIIPRNIIFDTMLSAQPFGREMPLSFIPEWFIKRIHYYGVEDLAPAHRGVFEGTPIVNDAFLMHVRTHRAAYVRCDTKRLTPTGVLINARSRTSHPGDAGEEREIRADVVVLATGFKKPVVDFLPRDLFPEGYERPNLYLQNFSTEDWSILMTNSAYENAIGTVGHFHIGIYTRILLTLLLDKNARPLPKDMKLWVDVLRYFKRGAAGGALGFFTYMELTLWLITFHILRPDRIKWMLFIMQGWGVTWREKKTHPQSV